MCDCTSNISLIPDSKTSNYTGQECTDCIEQFGAEYCNCQETIVEPTDTTTSTADTIKTGANLLTGVLGLFSKEKVEEKDNTKAFVIGSIIFIVVIIGVYVYYKNRN